MLSRGLDYSPTTSSGKFARRRATRERTRRKRVYDCVLIIEERKKNKRLNLIASRKPSARNIHGKDELSLSLSRASILTAGNKITRVASRYRGHRQGKLRSPLTDSDMHRDVFDSHDVVTRRVRVCDTRSTRFSRMSSVTRGQTL